MDAELILSAIEELVNRMTNVPKAERIVTYSAIKTLIGELREMAVEKCRDKGYASEKFANLSWSCASIAGLDDGNGHSAEQHQSWALTAVETLRGVNCFDVK